MKRVYISERAFADDVVIITENEKGLQQNLNNWNTVLKENGLKLNKSKTKVIVIGDRLEEIKLKKINDTFEKISYQ